MASNIAPFNCSFEHVVASGLFVWVVGGSLEDGIIGSPFSVQVPH